MITNLRMDLRLNLYWQFTIHIPSSLAGGIVLVLVEHEDAAHGLHGDEGAHCQHQQHPEHAEDVVGALAARTLRC